MVFNQFLALSFLQLKRIKRSFEGLGIFRFLFVLAIAAAVGFSIFTFLSNGEGLEIAIVLFLLLMLTLQIQRKDKSFLKINFNHHRRILFYQYLLLSLPLIFFLLYHSKWVLLLASISGIIAVPFFNYKIKNSNFNTKIQQWIPDDAFEWKAGMRKYLLFMVAAWAGGLAFSFFTGAVPIALFVLGLIPLKFFEIGEPAQMLIASEKSPVKLIMAKFKTHTAIFTLISLPLMLMFFLLHSEIWYLVLVEFVILLSLHFYFMLLKYAWYVPNQKPGSIEVFSGIGAVGVIIPIFLPLVWLLTLWFYFKAIANLKQYLHDFD